MGIAQHKASQVAGNQRENGMINMIIGDSFRLQNEGRPRFQLSLHP